MPSRLFLNLIIIKYHISLLSIIIKIKVFFILSIYKVKLLMSTMQSYLLMNKSNFQTLPIISLM